MNKVLITGSHRSGSTWVGKTLGTSAKVRYVFEPFHPVYRFRSGIKHWFEYVYKGHPNQDQIESYLRSRFDYPVSRFLYEMTKVLRGHHPRKQAKPWDSLSRKFTASRLVMKDPLALFSAEWLAKKFNMKVVILIRRPEAFAGSLKIKNWKFPFTEFVVQPKLLDRFGEYENQIKHFAEVEQDIVDQAILLWNIFHSQILLYRQDHPDWYFVTHESLSANPKEEYQKLCDFIKIEFNKSIQRAVIESTQAKQEEEFRRDSSKNVFSWQDRLTTAEIKRIKKGTSSIVEYFY